MRDDVPIPEPHLRVNDGFEKEWHGSDALATECVIKVPLQRFVFGSLGFF
jgi:hypothetical protein